VPQIRWFSSDIVRSIDLLTYLLTYLLTLDWSQTKTFLVKIEIVTSVTQSFLQ